MQEVWIKGEWTVVWHFFLGVGRDPRQGLYNNLCSCWGSVISCLMYPRVCSTGRNKGWEADVTCHQSKIEGGEGGRWLWRSLNKGYKKLSFLCNWSTLDSKEVMLTCWVKLFFVSTDIICTAVHWTFHVKGPYRSSGSITHTDPTPSGPQVLNWYPVIRLTRRSAPPPFARDRFPGCAELHEVFP